MTDEELRAIRVRHEAVSRGWEIDDKYIADGEQAHADRATLLRALDAEREARLAAEALIAGPVAWLDSWAKHVGDCKGGYKCTCGLVVARQESRGALEALAKET